MRVRLITRLVIMTFCVGVFILLSESNNEKISSKPKGEDTISYSSKDLYNEDEVLLNDVIHDEVSTNLDYQIFSSEDIRYGDIEYVKTKTYNIIMEIYSEINFVGPFSQSNIDHFDYYREIYHKMLTGSKSYVSTIKNQSFENELSDVKNHTYYLYDIGNNDTLEMIINNGERYLYIFKYDDETDEIVLTNILSTYGELLGDNKKSVWYSGIGMTYTYYEFEEQGSWNKHISFYSGDYQDKITDQICDAYFIGFGKDSEEMSRFKSKTNNQVEQIYYHSWNNMYYFRVQKYQYENLINDYFEAEKSAVINIEKVKYSYDDLFGDL